MNTEDPYEQAFRKWLRGVWLEAEQANMNKLVYLLQRKGYTITFEDYTSRFLVDGVVTITMWVARRIRPETVVQWVEEHLKSVRKGDNDHGHYAG
jgi:hypothetical protein